MQFTDVNKIINFKEDDYIEFIEIPSNINLNIFGTRYEKNIVSKIEIRDVINRDGEKQMFLSMYMGNISISWQVKNTGNIVSNEVYNNGNLWEINIRLPYEYELKEAM